MPTALAISPHLDDAVFSAGGTLTRLACRGWHVVVATVFTASVADPRGFALSCQLDKGLAPGIDYMALRRDEDAAACAILGVTPVWLPFLEAPHRGYDSASALFTGLRDDDVIVAEIVPPLATLIENLAPTLILAPQCIGAHVDHVAVYHALRECRGDLRFWTDFPYAARQHGKPTPFYQDIAKSTPIIHALQYEELEAKVAAALRYASQLEFQFGGTSAAQDAIRSFGAVEQWACRNIAC